MRNDEQGMMKNIHKKETRKGLKKFIAVVVTHKHNNTILQWNFFILFEV